MRLVSPGSYLPTINSLYIILYIDIMYQRPELFLSTHQFSKFIQEDQFTSQ